MTVRTWFRQMRAAEWLAERHPVAIIFMSGDFLHPFVRVELETLVELQQFVDIGIPLAIPGTVRRRVRHDDAWWTLQ